MLILCHLFLSYLLILVLKIGYYVVNIPKVQTWFGSLLSNDSLSRARAALPLLNYMTLPFSNSLHARSVSSKFWNPGGPLKKKRFLFVRFGLWGWLGWSLFWFWFWWHRRACRWDMVGLDQGWEGDFSHKCQGRLDSLVEGTSHVHDGDFFFF